MYISTIQKCFCKQTHNRDKISIVVHLSSTNFYLIINNKI